MNEFRSEAFDQAAKGPGGWSVTTDDVLSGVDALIARGILDGDRMGLYGFSNGGAIVDDLITKTNRFKCAVSVGAAIAADWAAQFLLTSQMIVPTVVGKAPWQSPRGYAQLSSIYRLDKINTPLLLASGDEDGALLPAIEMFNGLRYLGKDVMLLRYPDQGHGFTGSAQKDFWIRQAAYFEQYLRSR